MPAQPTTQNAKKPAAMPPPTLDADGFVITEPVVALEEVEEAPPEPTDQVEPRPRQVKPALVAASILLNGMIGRPIGHSRPNALPDDESHAKEAAEWADDLLKQCGNDPRRAEAVARVIVGYMLNPQSQHCSRDDFNTYGIKAVKRMIRYTR
jgi:hypothetical protein